MKLITKRSMAAILAVAITQAGCATIFSDSNYDYNFESEPSGATVTILSKGNEITRITTPGSHRLDLGNDYNIKFELPGYETQILKLEKDVDLWIIGSFVCTGLIGVAVDALTGAIYEPNTTIIKWRFQPKSGVTRRGAQDRMLIALEFSGNNGRKILAELEMEPGEGTVYHQFRDLNSQLVR